MNRLMCQSVPNNTPISDLGLGFYAGGSPTCPILSVGAGTTEHIKHTDMDRHVMVYIAMIIEIYEKIGCLYSSDLSQ
jgi:hypothetical protein